MPNPSHWTDATLRAESRFIRERIRDIRKGKRDTISKDALHTFHRYRELFVLARLAIRNG